jgi:WD40 repeat protein
MCHINLYDPATGKLLRTLATPDGKPSAPCDALAFSTDGARLASGAQDQVVRLWEVATGRQLWESPRHQRSVSGLGFSHDGKRLVSTTGGILRISPSGLGNRKAPGWPTDSEKIDPVAKVWETETGREIMSLTLPGKTQAVAISPDGETVAAAFGRSKTIISIQLGFGAGSREAASFEDNPEGDKSIRLYGVPSGEVVATLKGHPRPTRAIAFSPDGQRIVTAGGSANTLKLWDPASGEEILTLGPQPAGLNSVAFNASGTRIVSGSLEEVRLWDATPVPPGR